MHCHGSPCAGSPTSSASKTVHTAVRSFVFSVNVSFYHPKFIFATSIVSPLDSESKIIDLFQRLISGGNEGHVKVSWSGSNLLKMIEMRLRVCD